MPTREDVFRAADEMRAEAIRISIRAVRRRLPSGGSYRSIGEHLAEWKVDRCYQPTLEASQVPEPVQRQLAALGKTLWDEAVKEAARQLAAERRRIDGISLENERLRDEGLIVADLAESRIRDAEHRAQELACELAVARARIADLTRQNAVSGDGFAEPDLIRPDAVPEVSEAPSEPVEGNDRAPIELDPAAKRRLANEFWDRVMIEVQALMRRLSQEGQETFRAAELLVYLPKELLDEAERRHENLTASVLSSRMATRAKYKRFFVKEPNRAAFTLLEGYQHAG